jgi:hypothetical protein
MKKAILAAAVFGVALHSATLAQAASDPTPAASPIDKFVNIPNKDDMSSKVVGLAVYNAAKQDIGSIKDIAFENGVVTAYIVGVGGFLGMDEHYVAVRASEITINWDTGTKKWNASMDTSVDELKAAPEYKYPPQCKRIARKTEGAGLVEKARPSWWFGQGHEDDDCVSPLGSVRSRDRFHPRLSMSLGALA